MIFEIIITIIIPVATIFAVEYLVYINPDALALPILPGQIANLYEE